MTRAHKLYDTRVHVLVDLIRTSKSIQDETATYDLKLYTFLKISSINEYIFYERCLQNLKHT